MNRNIIFILMPLMVPNLASKILDYGYVDHMECNISEEYCSNSECKLSFKSRLVKQFTWKCNLIKKIDAVDVRVVLYYRFRAGYKQFLIDVSSDFCSYHKNNIGSAVLDLISETFKNYTKNVWQKCPYLPGNYSVTNLPITAALVKNLFVPAGDYKLIIITRVNGEQEASLTTITLFFNIPAGRTIEDDNMG